MEYKELTLENKKTKFLSYYKYKNKYPHAGAGREGSILMKYFEGLKNQWRYKIAKNKKTIFIGQAVEVPGTAMSNTLKDINKKKLAGIACS